MCQTADYIFLFQGKTRFFFFMKSQSWKKLRCHLIVKFVFKCSLIIAIWPTYMPSKAGYQHLLEHFTAQRRGVVRALETHLGLEGG